LARLFAVPCLIVYPLTGRHGPPRIAVSIYLPWAPKKEAMDVAILLTRWLHPYTNWLVPHPNGQELGLVGALIWPLNLRGPLGISRLRTGCTGSPPGL
jgi:hypothetical protein